MAEERIDIEYERFRLDFKSKYSLDVDFDTYKRIKADEARARGVQEEAKEFGMPGVSVEENNAKCHNCSGGLSYIEHVLYGNRCVFCADQEESIGLLKFLLSCLFDWIIYRELPRIKKLKGETARMYLLGCLGALGLTDVNQANKISAKFALLKELKGIK